MSITNSLFNRDISRLVRSDDAPKLIGRPTTDPDLLAENEFILKHGMTRAQAAKMRAVRQRQNFEDEAICDLNGSPPELTNTRGLGAKRASYANFLEWQHRETKRRDHLLQRRFELEAKIAAPAATQEKIDDAVKKTAASMMGRANAGEDVNRGALDGQLSQQKHLAEAAQIAIVEVDREIETAELRVAHLSGREEEFLHPALVEIADEVGLGKLLLRKIGELRAVCELMNGLAHIAGDFGSGFGQPQPINFAKVGLPSLANTPSAEYSIPAAGNDRLWAELAQALKFNPKMDAAKFIAVPK